MKTISVRELQKNVKECVDYAQHDRVVITRHGKPAAVLLGVEGRAWDDIVVETDPKLWRLIQTRRRVPTMSLAELKQRLGQTPRAGGARRLRRRTG